MTYLGIVSMFLFLGIIGINGYFERKKQKENEKAEQEYQDYLKRLDAIEKHKERVINEMKQKYERERV